MHWEFFGIFLRGIKSSYIESIEKHSLGCKQKFDLYVKWLKVCPDGSWSDVVTALEKAKEFTLAERIKSLHNNEQHESLEDLAKDIPIGRALVDKQSTSYRGQYTLCRQFTQ